jgi:poly(hydroxyalkanoate) depolymerase family esterase
MRRAGASGIVMLASLACASAPMRREVPSAFTHGKYTHASLTRDYALFEPSTTGRIAPRALVVMLHGCTQDAADMARGTRMNEAAEREDFTVLYPEQPATAHPQRCWNWYVPAQSGRDAGEAGLLAAMIDSVAGAHHIDAGHVALVGMSAGAAMAANLVVAYPERFGALAMHSGIAAGAATDVAGALRAMRQGNANGDVLGAAAFAAMGSRARAIPVLVMHGTDDKVVSPANLHAVVRQWTVVRERTGSSALVEEHVFTGVGHAWSGGAAEGSYTAPAGPSATELIVAFLSRAGVLPAR